MAMTAPEGKAGILCKQKPPVDTNPAIHFQPFITLAYERARIMAACTRSLEESSRQLGSVDTCITGQTELSP